MLGAIIGGIIGGGKGALIGVLVGGGGTIAATEGADVDLPVGTILRIRIDQPLELAARADLTIRRSFQRFRISGDRSALRRPMAIAI